VRRGLPTFENFAACDAFINGYNDLSCAKGYNLDATSICAGREDGVGIPSSDYATGCPTASE
jgi:hypothetical protein